MLRSHFRDEFVAASLKRSCVVASRYSIDRNFRDELVAASLKLISDCAASHASSRHFRDESVAASLKQYELDAIAGRSASFPRRIRRGLIEAFDRSDCAASRAEHFRDEFVAASLKPQSVARI